MQKEVLDLKSTFSKIPMADRLVIARDIKRYPEGIPSDVIFSPTSWCGKKPVKLSAGEGGFMEYIEHVTSKELEETLKKVALVAGIGVMALVAILLLNKVLPEMRADSLAREAVKNGALGEVLDEKAAVEQLSKFIQEKTAYPYAGVINADALNRSFETSGLVDNVVKNL